MTADSFDKLAQDFNKKWGDHTAMSADTLVECPRISTGIFTLDLMLGGGVPEGRISEFFGIPGCCKSNVLYKTIATKQRLNPDQKNAVIDIENTLTPDWCHKMGVDAAKLLVLKPHYGEHAVDMTEALMNSPECGIVALDSLAAMITTREAENSAEKADPGGQAQFAKKLINKVILAQRAAEAFDRTPTFIYVNQLKYKIGVLYGDPSTTPGGESPKFASTLRLRFYAKDVREEKWSKTHPARKAIHIVVVKHKVPIVARECEFEMAMIPHAGFNVGEVDEWKTIWHFLKKHGMVTEASGNKWTIGKQTLPTQKAIQEYLAEDAESANAMKQAIIFAETQKAYNEQHVGKTA